MSLSFQEGDVGCRIQAHDLRGRLGAGGNAADDDNFQWQGWFSWM
jgi:hypothetical protein